MRRTLWFTLECRNDHRLDVLIADLTRAPDARLVVESFEPLVREASSPDTDRVAPNPNSLGDGLVGQPFYRQKHDPTSLRESVGTLAAAHMLLKRRLLFGGHNNPYGFSSRHAPSNRAGHEKCQTIFDSGH
jgi:hypothetical protein